MIGDPIPLHPLDEDVAETSIPEQQPERLPGVERQMLRPERRAYELLRGKRVDQEISGVWHLDDKGALALAPELPANLLERTYRVGQVFQAVEERDDVQLAPYVRKAVVTREPGRLDLTRVVTLELDAAGATCDMACLLQEATRAAAEIAIVLAVYKLPVG